MLDRKCRAPRLAYESCVEANSGNRIPCLQLENRLTECLAETVCPRAAEVFQKCVIDSFSLDVKEWSPTACDKEVQEMQKCLRKARIFPIPLQRTKR